MAAPQFGEAPDEAVPDRATAFAVIERDGQIAVVRCDRIRKGRVLDLPGGGIDPGETARDAAMRECVEEAGLIVDLDHEPFARADQYFLHNDAQVRNSRGQFFAGRPVRIEPARKIEDDHDLVWISPQEAVVRLDRESHVWAVATWLRLRAAG
jgi:8-oxo-dGTP diphosphatase